MNLIVDGNTVFAATGGREFSPDGNVVLMLHGSGMDHTIWGVQARYLAWHGFDILAPDFPGHGRSDGDVLTSVDDLAAWVARLMDSAAIKSAALVGHSLGALVALTAGASLPHRIDRLALLGVAERMPVHPDLLAAAKNNDPLAFDLISAWGIGPQASLGRNASPGMWMMGGSQRLLRRSRDGALYDDLKACDDFGRAPDMAARLACPALLIAGSDDRMTPPKGGRRLAKTMTNARFEIIQDAGHMMMVEKPDKVTDSLAAFLSAEESK